MTVSKLFAAVAAFAVAGSVFAVDLSGASAAVSAAAAAQLSSAAARSLNVPVILVDKSAGASRAEVRAEAVAAVKNYRATTTAQFDWLAK